jgi:hypothetical protein
MTIETVVVVPTFESRSAPPFEELNRRFDLFEERIESVFIQERCEIAAWLMFLWITLLAAQIAILSAVIPR